MEYVASFQLMRGHSPGLLCVWPPLKTSRNEKKTNSAWCNVKHGLDYFQFMLVGMIEIHDLAMNDHNQY